MFTPSFDSIGRNLDRYEIRSYRSRIEPKLHGLGRVGPLTCQKKSPEIQVKYQPPTPINRPPKPTKKGFFFFIELSNARTLPNSVLKSIATAANEFYYCNPLLSTVTCCNLL